MATPRISKHGAVVQQVARATGLTEQQIDDVLRQYWFQLVSDAWAKGQVTLPGVFTMKKKVLRKPRNLPETTRAEPECEVMTVKLSHSLRRLHG